MACNFRAPSMQEFTRFCILATGEPAENGRSMPSECDAARRPGAAESTANSPALSNDRCGKQATPHGVDLLESQVFVESADQIPAPVAGCARPEDLCLSIDLLVDRAVEDPHQYSRS